MAYIPADAQWYLADLVIEINVEDDPRRVVHVNTVLVHANSPEAAHREALLLGQRQNDSYLNSKGKRVEFRFAGLKALDVIHEPLEHGAELYFSEYVGPHADEQLANVSMKESLAVFSEPRHEDKPDYGCGEIERDYAAFLASDTKA